MVVISPSPSSFLSQLTMIPSHFQDHLYVQYVELNQFQNEFRELSNKFQENEKIIQVNFDVLQIIMITIVVLKLKLKMMMMTMIMKCRGFIL